LGEIPDPPLRRKPEKEWTWRFPISRCVSCSKLAFTTATSLGLFAEKYRDDTGSASELVAISTVLSALTLPLVMWAIASLL
jgi:predicted permease